MELHGAHPGTFLGPGPDARPCPGSRHRTFALNLPSRTCTRRLGASQSCSVVASGFSWEAALARCSDFPVVSASSATIDPHVGLVQLTVREDAVPGPVGVLRDPALPAREQRLGNREARATLSNARRPRRANLLGALHGQPRRTRLVGIDAVKLRDEPAVVGAARDAGSTWPDGLLGEGRVPRAPRLRDEPRRDDLPVRDARFEPRAQRTPGCAPRGWWRSQPFAEYAAPRPQRVPWRPGRRAPPLSA